MKYTIEGFNQQYALSLQKEVTEEGKTKIVRVDGIDLMILRWFVDFYPRMTKVEIGGVQYAWISYKELLNDMPILGIGKQMLSLRLKKLVDFEVLSHQTVKNGGCYSYYGFGKKYINLIEKNEGGIQKITEGYVINYGGGIQKITEGVCNKLLNKDPSTINPSTKDPSTKDSFGKKESKPKNGYGEIIDSYTANEDLKEALWEFIKMRKFIKKPMTDRALKSIMNKLDTLASADTEKIAILDQSITNSWQGVYPLKQDNGGGNNGGLTDEELEIWGNIGTNL